MIQFFIPGEPPTVTAQQKGYNRRTKKYYKPAELRDAEQKYMAYANEVRPAQPLEGAINLSVIFGFRVRGDHVAGEPKTSKPDTDNMVKALKDCLTRCRFWNDDAQVAAERSVKFWTDETPGILVVIRTWDELPEDAT
jgi:Holliday junction resolvase RusA-like endonuclease